MRPQIFLFLEWLVLSFTGRAEVGAEEMLRFAERTIRGQAGDSKWLWEPAINGGYLLHFSADILGDAAEEDFLVTTMGMDGSRGSWDLYCGGKRVDSVELSVFGFRVIPQNGAVIIPYGGRASGSVGYASSGAAPI
jgi:hypothetical protein